MQGTSFDKIYQELGLESLKYRRWYKRLSCTFKIMKKEVPNYLINLIPKCEAAIRTRKKKFRIAIVEETVSSIFFPLQL